MNNYSMFPWIAVIVFTILIVVYLKPDTAIRELYGHQTQNNSQWSTKVVLSLILAFIIAAALQVLLHN